jgi:DNA-binding Lrp family transcriptional regulator
VTKDMIKMTSKKDLLIITNLRNNARMPLTKMSKNTHIPVSTIFDRLKVNDIIVKHTSLIDFAKLGYKVRAQIAFKVDIEDKEALREFFMKSEVCNSVLKINNGYDFMIEGVFREIKEMEDFLENLDQKFRIIEKTTFYIIEDLKKEAFMSNPNLILAE